MSGQEKSQGRSGGQVGDVSTAAATPSKMTVFRPPIVRSGANALNRALFSQRINLAAAAINDNRLISKYRKALEKHKEILVADRVSPIALHPDKTLASQGRKCLLLNLDVKPEGQR